jgi:hypothetical protein
MISTTLFIMIVSVAVMIFFQTYKSLEVVSIEQEGVNQLISLQLIKPHIRIGEEIIYINGKIEITKRDKTKVSIYHEGDNLFIDSYDQNGILLNKQIILSQVTAFQPELNGPCSVSIGVTSENRQYRISEFCR